MFSDFFKVLTLLYVLRTAHMLFFLCVPWFFRMLLFFFLRIFFGAYIACVCRTTHTHTHKPKCGVNLPYIAHIICKPIYGTQLKFFGTFFCLFVLFALYSIFVCFVFHFCLLCIPFLSFFFLFFCFVLCLTNTLRHTEELHICHTYATSNDTQLQLHTYL